MNVQRLTKTVEKIIVLEFAMALAFSGAAFILGVNSTSIFIGLVALCILVFLTYAYSNYWRIPVCKDRASLYINSVFVFALISTIANIQSTSYAVTGRCLLSILLAKLLISFFYSGKDALRLYVTVLRFLSLVSIICWFIFTVIGVSASFMPFFQSSSNAGVGYNSILIYSQMSGTTRNNGPFWEPSIFAAFLFMGLVFSRFYLYEDKKSRWIFYLAIFTTQSSGGILMLLLYFVCCIWEKPSRKKSKSIILKILCLFIVIVIAVLWDAIGSALMSINYDIFSKIFNLKAHGSSLTRIDSVAIDFRIWLTSPFLGVGVDRVETMFLEMRDIFSKITGMSHASTNSYYLAAFGIGGIWINILWIIAIMTSKKTVVWRIVMLIGFIIALNETPQISFTWTYFILFALLKYVNASDEF